MKSRWRLAWWGLLLLLLGLGLSRLRFDAEILNLLPTDQPTVQGLKLYQEHFANARELIITLRAPDSEQAERLAGALATWLRQETNLIAGVSWQAPWMEHPEQAAEIVACLWFNQPPESFGTLTNRLAPDHLQSVLAETREVLATSLSPMDIARRAFDPYDLLSVPALANFSGLSAEQGQRAFASADGTFRLIYVQARTDLTGYRECASWLKAVQDAVASVRTNQTDWAGVVVRYTGRPAFVTEIASNMQRDLSGSVTATAVIIALLFWLMHRRWLPVLWLLTLLALILVATLALGSLILGPICVVSMGFAAVLLGLAVDYAVVHYQEALAHPQLSVPEIRRAIAPSILWAAITTISAFLVLNFGGLPGLAQLGSLVAIGVALAALVMVMAYLPPLFPGRRNAPAHLPKPAWWTFLLPPKEAVAARPNSTGSPGSRAAFWVTVLVLIFTGTVLSVRQPKLDRTANALRPQQAEAETALNELTASMGIPRDPIWVIVGGSDEGQVYERLCKAEALLKQAVSNQTISGFMLPTVMWPRPECQAANRAAARVLGAQGQLLRETAVRAGFETNALFLTEELVRTWARLGDSSGVVWPTNLMSQWVLKQFVARTPNEWLAMGLVYPATNRIAGAALADLSAQMAPDRILLSGWELLGATTLKRVQGRLWLLVVPMVGLVLVSLWLAFRRITEVLLGVAVLLLSGLCLLTTMALAGWSWNLLNLMALPLVLGTGVDYGLFIQLALRRHGGDTRLVRRSVGRALLLCGGTAITGFGSLSWSGNAGMASLGKVCAVGIAANMLIAIFLLPAWWAWLSPKSEYRNPKEAQNPKSESNDEPSRQVADKSPIPCQPSSLTQHTTFNSQPSTLNLLSAPSSFYRAGLWRLGLGIARILPVFVFNAFCLLIAECYYRLHRERRTVVRQNLLPALHSDQAAARKTAHRLFRQFALKMADVWRYESGVLKQSWLNEQKDWDHFEAVKARGQGVLLITPHLGNWELGGPLLAHHGYQLLALTQAEPDDALTQLRMASRARWGIETLVVGDDGFAFVEIIKRLQSGAIVAMLIDRPPAPSAVTVELFGQPFLASIAAAELARASGCALLGVTLTRSSAGYTARVLPEITYDRRALGTREARRELTGKIMRAFEPEIRQHLDQWYHFVPIWPEKK
jgi:predicted RND superfamily exporter protein/lauroyl/myristoyl acyltransferase